MEIAGTMIGIGGLASIFTSCVGCFEMIRFGRKFGDDYETCMVKLGVAHLRTSRWGHSLGTAQDSTSIPHITAKTGATEIAQRLLAKIRKTLEDAWKTSQEYEKSADTSSLLQTCIGNRALMSKFKRLSVKLHESATRYKTSSQNFPRAAAWEIYEKEIFDRMIEDIIELVDQLVEAFPNSIAAQQRLAAQEVAPIEDAEEMQLLVDVAKEEEDILLEKAVEQKTMLRGSVYNKLEASKKSEILAGDAMERMMQGRSHTYNQGATFDESFGHFGNVYQE